MTLKLSPLLLLLLLLTVIGCIEVESYSDDNDGGGGGIGKCFSCFGAYIKKKIGEKKKTTTTVPKTAVKGDFDVAKACGWVLFIGCCIVVLKRLSSGSGIPDTRKEEDNNHADIDDFEEFDNNQ